MDEVTQKYWECLGWTQQSWKSSAPAPASSDCSWKDLPAEQQAAATRLGYTEDTWNSESWSKVPVSKAPAAKASSANTTAVAEPKTYTCNETKQPIVGVRYHKRGADYDLCEAEFKKLTVVQQMDFECIDKTLPTVGSDPKTLRLNSLRK